MAWQPQLVPCWAAAVSHPLGSGQVQGLADQHTQYYRHAKLHAYLSRHVSHDKEQAQAREHARDTSAARMCWLRSAYGSGISVGVPAVRAAQSLQTLRWSHSGCAGAKHLQPLCACTLTACLHLLTITQLLDCLSWPACAALLCRLACSQSRTLVAHQRARSAAQRGWHADECLPEHAVHARGWHTAAGQALLHSGACMSDVSLVCHLRAKQSCSHPRNVHRLTNPIRAWPSSRSAGPTS